MEARQVGWIFASEIPEPSLEEIQDDSILNSAAAIAKTTKRLKRIATHEAPMLFTWASADECDKFIEVFDSYRKRTAENEIFAQRLRGKWARANIKTSGRPVAFFDQHFPSAHLCLHVWCRAQAFTIWAAVDEKKLRRMLDREPVTFDSADVRDRWPKVRAALENAWEDPGGLFPLIEAERDAAIEAMGAKPPEPDGPVDGFRWRHNSELINDTMAEGAWRLASYLYHAPDHAADYATLAPVVADDHSETLLDYSNCRGHRHRANIYFKRHGIPWHVELQGKPKLVLVT